MPSVDPAHQALYRNDDQRTLDIVCHRDVDRVTLSKIDPLEELGGDRDLTVRTDLEGAVGRVHLYRLRNLVDFVVMALTDSLGELLDEAERLPTNGERLLAATELAQAINQVVLRDPVQLEAVRIAVRDAAAAAGCDLIVGASQAADEVVRPLNAEGTVPTRVLLFDIVRITGAALSHAAAELRHVAVVPAVFVDLRSASVGAAPSSSMVLREISGC